MKKNHLFILLMIAFALLIGILAFADDDNGIKYPAAYCFTEEEMQELRDMLIAGEIEEAINSIDGRLDMETIRYIINPRTGKYHVPTCPTIKDIIYPIGYTGTSEEASAAGFSKCGRCLKNN